MLSVIIPSYNRCHTLQRALESVLVQQAHGFGETLEVIVVDDGSTDTTKAMLETHFPEVIYRYQANSGVSAARNAGLALARGEWVALLDSDDEWLPHKLAVQFDALQQSGLKVVHTEEIWIREGVRVNQMNKHKKSGGWIFERCLPLCAMSPSSIIIHRDVFAAVGEFDEALPACEDYDLWLRISSRFEVSYVAEACIKKYGGHEDQLSRQHWGMDRFRVLALQKFLRQNLDPSLNQAATTMLEKKLTILLKGALKHSNRDLIDECRRALDEFCHV